MDDKTGSNPQEICTYRTLAYASTDIAVAPDGRIWLTLDAAGTATGGVCLLDLATCECPLVYSRNALTGEGAGARLGGRRRGERLALDELVPVVAQLVAIKAAPAGGTAGGHKSLSFSSSKAPDDHAC